jgi:ABC-type lipoprotein export system ATPase subunit
VTAALELRDVFRVFGGEGGGVAALQGLTLDVREGEICVVLGPSGSGKTTLLRILAGLDRPSAGSARAFGLDLGRLRGRALSQYRSGTLGYAEQHYRRALAEELPARELVGVQLGLAGARGRDRAHRAEELLGRVGLADRAEAFPSELSGGEQQRVAICAALAHRPRLLLADEPTGELDRANATVVYELLGELARENGATTVIVSHDPASAAIADRIVHVRDGRVSEETARGAGDDTIVVGKGGWLRISEELLRRGGIGARATARLRPEGIVVEPVGARARPVAPTDGASPRPVAPARDASPAVELVRVRKAFQPGLPVLDGLDARLYPRRLYAVTGPSGSGKTTLLHLLAGLDLPDEGDIRVHGTPLSRLDRSERARFRAAGIALVGQEPGLVSFLSARENVALALELRGLDPAAAPRALAAVSLAERAEQRADVLSAGERERLAVARAVAVRPRLLLADEPTAKLDQANALAVTALFSRLARELGTTVVCATHDPVVIEQADEVLPLDDPGVSGRRGVSEPERAGARGA